MNKKQRILHLLFRTVKSVFVLFLVVMNIIMMGCIYKKEENEKDSERTETVSGADEQRLLAALSHKSDVTTMPENIDNEKSESEEIQPEAENEPLTDAAITLQDIYAQTGQEVMFTVFDKDAVSYRWEIYDLKEKEWKATEAETVCDDLFRKISAYKITADKEHHEAMIKCTIHYDTKEDAVQTASLYVLKDMVKDIQISDFTWEANTYLHTGNIPVSVTYADDSTENITGLAGLYFASTEEFKECTTSVSGNRTETVTLVTNETGNHYVEIDEQNVTVRYHTGQTEHADMEKTLIITGTDIQEPAIESVEISSFEVSRIDTVVPVTVTIAAEDNETAYPYLEYAFLIEHKEPEETDWIKKASFDVDIQENGTYIAYVRDEKGNIAKEEKSIIAVDNKAPNIQSVVLLNEAQWCKTNTLSIDATDALDMEYRFICKADGTDSDWISFNEYLVEVNGTWVIQARDAAGNISETEIAVNNIDKVAPVINGIQIKR